MGGNKKDKKGVARPVGLALNEHREKLIPQKNSLRKIPAPGPPTSLVPSPGGVLLF